MTTTINADTSGGLKLTSDISGELELQSAGVTQAKITSSGLQNASGSAITSQAGKNIIINGNMAIDQRNGGTSVTPTNAQYTLDRWRAYLTQASKYTFQQSTTAPSGFNYSLLATSSSAYTVGASDYFLLAHTIEGLNVAHLNWGTANAKTVTLSFWVRSSLTGTFGGSVANAAGNRSYPYSYTISAANTWEKKTITIAGDTTGTWATTNAIGMVIYWSLGVGSTLSGTAGSWAGANYLSTTGATSLVGTSGATLYITGVQLEAGTTATDFEYLQYGQQLALCQRYFEILGRILNGVGGATGTQYGTYSFKQTKRATPTVSATVAIYDTVLAVDPESVTITRANNAVDTAGILSAVAEL